MGLIVGLALVASGAFYANQPSKAGKDRIHVLPLVEEMATANPLQF